MTNRKLDREEITEIALRKLATLVKEGDIDATKQWLKYNPPKLSQDKSDRKNTIPEIKGIIIRKTAICSSCRKMIRRPAK